MQKNKIKNTNKTKKKKNLTIYIKFGILISLIIGIFFAKPLLYKISNLNIFFKQNTTENIFTKGEFAKEFCKILKIETNDNNTSYFQDVNQDNPNAKYINAMNFAFPAGFWDGKHWQALFNEPITRELAIKSFVIYKGFNLLDGETSINLINEQIPNFNSLNYSQNIKNYIATILKLGFDKKYITANKLLTKEESIELLSQLNDYFSTYQPNIIESTTPLTISNRSIDNPQIYYVDGPISNQFSVKSIIKDDNNLHQFTSILGDIKSYSNNTSYGIGVWGNAESHVKNAKMVGGFFTVSGVGEGVKSQLVGQEIDVINRDNPTDPQKYSSVGIQIVTIGSANSTAALEVISDTTSKWRHGVIFEENSISEDGIILAVAQKNKMKLGIDLGNSTFTDSALRLKNNQNIKFESKDYNPNYASRVFLSEDERFTITSGLNGLEIKSNDSTKNIVSIDKNGNILIDQGAFVMKSPNGTKFKIIVDDSGNINTQKTD